MSTSEPHPRYAMLDSLRGLCLLSMIAFHGMYDLVNIIGIPVPWFYGMPGYLWQQSICWTFILLSGFCWSFSRRPLRHGLILVGCGAMITLVTYFVIPSELIQYGVLTLLGLSALLFTALKRLFDKLHWGIPAPLGLGVSLFLLFLTRHFSVGSLSFDRPILYPLQELLSQTDLFAVLGFHSPTFFSADYFPLFPWFFLYAAGYFLWKLLSRHEKVMECLRPGFAPLAFLGRHSLLIYLLHQPLIFGLLTLLPI